MPIVDEKGRLFGRLNLLDALIALVFLVLIPLSYGSYLLFRVPPATLASVEPATIIYGPNMRVKIHGQNLRPYMRVSFNTTQGRTFLFNDTTEAEIELFDLPPGVYDVKLFDYSQQRGFLAKGLTIAPSAMPEAQMLVVGTFGNLKPEQVSAIKAGMTIPGIAEVVGVGKAVPQVTRVFSRPGTVEMVVPGAMMVPAKLKMGCWVRSSHGQPDCVAAEFSLQPTTLMFLATPIGTVPFQIDQVRGMQPIEPVEVTVRVSAQPGVLAKIQKGDVDLGDVRNELSATGTVVSVMPQGDSVRDVRLVVQAQRGTTSWLYAQTPLRLGAPFALQTPLYQVSGTIIGFTPPPDRAAGK